MNGFSWGQTLTDMFTMLGRGLLMLLLFLVIFLIGRFIAKLIRKAVVALLNKAGVDRHIERAGLTKALSTPTQRPSALIGTIVYLALMLVVLMGALAVAFGPNNPVSALLQQFLAYLPNVFVALAIVIVTGLVARKVTELSFGLLDGKVSNASTLARLIGGAVMVIGGFAALSQLHIAQSIVNGLFYAMLAIIVGSAVIAIGGGGIGPMRRQWEKTIDKLESDPVRQQAVGYRTSSSLTADSQDYPRHTAH